jgi:hypothetical protein
MIGIVRAEHLHTDAAAAHPRRPFDVSQAIFELPSGSMEAAV